MTIKLPIVVVTHRQEFVDFLLKAGYITDGNYRVVTRATENDVTNREVFGDISLCLASSAKSVTRFYFNLPKGRRKRATVDELYECFTGSYTYKVSLVQTGPLD